MIKITKVLKDYKNKKAMINTTIHRIEHLKTLLKKNNLHLLEYYSKHYLKLGIHTYSISSPVENEVFGNIDKNTMTKKLIQEWIKEDCMRIYPLQIEVEQIEMALQALTKSEYYIIECKYFDNMTWIEIEMSYNSTFNTTITDMALIKKQQEAIHKLHNILNKFYINIH